MPSKDSKVHRKSNFQCGRSLRNVGVHSLTLSYTPESMKCDSWALILAHTFASPCFGHEPKAKVAKHMNCNFVYFSKKLSRKHTFWKFWTWHYSFRLYRFPNKKAPNIPYPQIHYVSSNFVVFITYCFHMRQCKHILHFIPHVNHEPPIISPSHFNKPHTTY